MYNNEMTVNKIDRCRIRKNISWFLAIFIVLAFGASSEVLADIPTVKAAGIMTSVEDDGTVTIDKMGYLVDDSVQIIDDNEKSVSLQSLSLPAKVNFEYVYTQKGFVIIFIKKTTR